MQQAIAAGGDFKILEPHRPAAVATASPMLTSAQVAERLAVKEHRVWWLVRTKKIKATRIGRQIRISEAVLQEFIDGGGVPNR